MTAMLPIAGHPAAPASRPAQPLAAPASRPAQPPASATGAVVLLVEDEPAVREATKRILDRSGYRVLTAATGDDALALAGQQVQVDVLLTDVLMPKMRGKELADRIRALRPGIRILFMSDHTQDLLSAQGILEPGFHLIEKPFSKDLLLTKLDQLLA